MLINHTRLKKTHFCLLAGITLAWSGAANAAVITVNGDSPATLASDEANFYATVGESADFSENFNSFSDNDTLATVNAGVSGFTISNASGADPYISDNLDQGAVTNGLALEFDSNSAQSVLFTFSSPVDYFSFTDQDQPGILTITINFVGGATQALSINDTTGNNGIEFIGAYRNDAPNQIESFTFLQSGETDGVLLDDLQWGVIPEPNSLALLALGGLLVARRRRG